MISTQNLSHFDPVGKRSKFMKAVGYLDLDEFFVEVRVILIGSFYQQMECDTIFLLSLNVVVLSNKFSFEPQHYLEDSYIPIFALMYTLELLGLQLFKWSLGNRFCSWHSSLLNYWRHRTSAILMTLFKIISSEVCLASTRWLGSNALKWWPCRGPPPPREPCVLRSAYLCNRLFLQTVIRLYCKLYLHNFGRK